MSNVVEFNQVSKRYKIGARATSLREAITSLPKNLFRRKDQAIDESNILWSVRDLSFQVDKGQVLGLIGSNGAGKTTTLKLLSRITRPTHGSIHVNGRVSSLIELGAGFHPDLTGRENVYLNGVILGLKKKEIDQRFDKIVAFAEMERFIDMPVKRYSSGMYARLGFAVAAHTDPDLLLIDEVLAVGDTNFQRKCYDFIGDFVTSGKTAIFVSHNMFVIEQLCSHVIWLDSGKMAAEGAPREVLTAYLDSMEQRRLNQEQIDIQSNGYLKIEGVHCYNTRGEEQTAFQTGEDVVVEIQYNALNRIQQPYFVLGISESQDIYPLAIASMLADGNAPATIDGRGSVRCVLKSIPLRPRVYYLWGEIFNADRVHMHLEWQKMGAFQVALDGDGPQGSGSIRHTRIDAPVSLSYEWQFEKAQSVCQK